MEDPPGMYVGRAVSGLCRDVDTYCVCSSGTCVWDPMLRFWPSG